MEARVSRGHLEYRDEKGSYRIPVGRRTRKRMMVLDKKEGEYIRSLEMDLFTGFVYYCVDNETSGGLSYYYDMSSKKVGHYFIHRYLRLARNHGFTCSPQEEEIFEKLPCDNWAEEMGKLPGWTEAIENRMESLLLPGRDPLKIPARDLASAFCACADSASAVSLSTGPAPAGSVPAAPAAPDPVSSGTAAADPAVTRAPVKRVTFVEAPAAYPTRKREYVFDLGGKEDRRILHYLDDTVGNEFFGEDEEYDRILSADERRLLVGLAAPFLREGAGGADMCRNAPQISTELCRQLCGLLSRRESFLMEEVRIRLEDGSEICAETDTEEKTLRARALEAAMRGLLRREIEIG